MQSRHTVTRLYHQWRNWDYLWGYDHRGGDERPLPVCKTLTKLCLGLLSMEQLVSKIVIFSFTPWVPSYPNPVFFALKLECSIHWIWNSNLLRFCTENSLQHSQDKAGWQVLQDRAEYPQYWVATSGYTGFLPTTFQLEGWYYLLIAWVMQQTFFSKLVWVPTS